MNQKKAKALRREARKFAIEHDHATDTYQTVARKKKVLVRAAALLPNGTFNDDEIEEIRTQDILSGDPRFFYQCLKKAFRSRTLAL